MTGDGVNDAPALKQADCGIAARAAAAVAQSFGLLLIGMEWLSNPDWQSWRKISEGDYAERPFWDAYTDAFQDALGKCSTEHAPWFIIPSNHKWFRNLAISKIIVEALDSLGMKFPAPMVDIDEIKKKYHAIVEAEGGEDEGPTDDKKGKKGKKAKKSKKGK